jgi:hypothetical protein
VLWRQRIFCLLVGGVCKIISKLLATRFKSILEKIISNSQDAFIVGRQILDSMLIAIIWIVFLDWGKPGYCANWIWRRHMIISIEISCFICLSDVVLGRNGRVGYSFVFPQ